MGLREEAAALTGNTGPRTYSLSLNLPLNPPEQVAAFVTPAGIEWRTTITV